VSLRACRNAGNYSPDKKKTTQRIFFQTRFKNWREDEPSQEVSLKSPEEAFKEFRIRQFESNQGIPEKVNITRISLGYQIQQSENLAEYLEPVYIFEGYNQNGDIHEGFNPVIIKVGLTDLSTVT
jgi:hypothetical protein